MTPEEKRDHVSRRGTAALVAVLVQTIQESDPTFRDRFLERLGRLWRHVRDESGEPGVQELELFDWTRENLTGFSKVHGQGEPLLGDD